MPFLLRAYLGEADVGRGSGVVNADSQRVLNLRRSSRCTPILQQHLLSSATRQASISTCCAPRHALCRASLYTMQHTSAYVSIRQHASSVTRRASISACCVPRPALFWHALHSLLQPAVAFHWPSECLFRYL